MRGIHTKLTVGKSCGRMLTAAYHTTCVALTRLTHLGTTKLRVKRVKVRCTALKVSHVVPVVCDSVCHGLADSSVHISKHDALTTPPDGAPFMALGDKRSGSGTRTCMTCLFMQAYAGERDTYQFPTTIREPLRATPTLSPRSRAVFQVAPAILVERCRSHRKGKWAS